MVLGRLVISTELLRIIFDCSCLNVAVLFICVLECHVVYI